jgi:hypothetical protein
MSTTFSSAFKTRFIDCLTGRASSNYVLQYLAPYNGAQPADPLSTPAGSSVYSGYTSSIIIQNFMSAPGGGVSQLAAPQQRVANATVANLTFARIYDTGGVAVIDTPVSLAGGNGGAILGSLASSSGVALSLDAFSFKWPMSLNTVKVSSAFANAMVAAFCNNAATVGLFTSSSIHLYSGTPPASADDAATGTLLATFTLGATSPWNAAVAGAATLGANLTATGLANGTATYARVVKGSVTGLQGSVGTSGTDFIIDNANITTGGTVTMTGGTLTF